jgi:alkaline phosphatase
MSIFVVTIKRGFKINFIDMKTKFINLLLILILVSTGSIISTNESYAGPPKRPKNIILLIGDGMGDAHVYAAMSVSQQQLNMAKFPFSGFIITRSANNYVTDSGAGGTALSCGVKTNNGMIGMTPDSTVVPSIIDIVHKRGMATGVVSTSSVTHATPASFVAHNVSRNNYEAIAADYLNGTIDVFIGGGENNFRKRQDGKDLTADLESQGFDVVYTLEEMWASNSENIAGLLAKDHMPTVLEGRQGVLEAMTSKAIQTLSKDKDGFFLMVEGSQIDWGGHANDAEYTITETIDFDQAVGAALDFARMDGRTLVIVTADHETGGLTIPAGDANEGTITVKFSTPNHSAVMVPVFSFGPGADKFSGINENTFFLDMFLELLKIRR